jgi:hypothetical protein
MYYFVPYAYDRITARQTSGGSIARCNALLKTKNELGIDMEVSTFVLTAGFSKESPLTPTVSASEAICHQMADYLASQGFPKKDIFHVPAGWGTYWETRAAVDHIRWSECGDQHKRVYVSTNGGHMPRVRICWYFLAPKGWSVKFVSADHSFGDEKECLGEVIKFFVYLYKFVLKKW